MQASSNLLIVISKKNKKIANLLMTKATELGYKVAIMMDKEYEASVSTKVAQRVVFLEDSKPMLDHRDSLNKIFDLDGINLYIGANQVVIDVDQKNIRNSVQQWFPKNSLSKIADFNDHDGEVHKTFNKVGKWEEKLNKKTNRLLKKVPIAKLITNSDDEKMTYDVLDPANHVYRKDLIDDADVAGIYMFVDNYLSDFMNSTSDEQPTYKTEAQIRQMFEDENKSDIDG